MMEKGEIPNFGTLIDNPESINIVIDTSSSEITHNADYSGHQSSYEKGVGSLEPDSQGDGTSMESNSTISQRTSIITSPSECNNPQSVSHQGMYDGDKKENPDDNLMNRLKNVYRNDNKVNKPMENNIDVKKNNGKLATANFSNGPSHYEPQNEYHYRTGAPQQYGDANLQEIYYYMKVYSQNQFKWDVLKNLDDNLVERDVMQLKFLCTDIIPGSELEKISRGFELFDCLEKMLYMMHTNFLILAELMFRIGRIDLLKSLVTDVQRYKQAVNRTPSDISKYRVLLHEIAEDTVVKELQAMKFYLSDQFKRAKLDTVNEPQELFSMMEKKQLLGEKNMNCLLKIMKQINKKSIASKIEHYKGNIYPGNPIPLSQWSKSNVGGGYLLTTEIPKQVRDNEYDRQRAQFVNARQPVKENDKYHHAQKTSKLITPTGIMGTIKDVQNVYKHNNPEAINHPNITAVSDNNSDYLHYLVDPPFDQRDFSTVQDINGGYPPCGLDSEHYFQDGINMTLVDRFEQTTNLLPEYKMDARPRGICVIINNKLFDKGEDKSRELKVREGSDVDRDNLESIFTQLSFEVHIHENLNGVDMVRVINDYAYNIDHTNYDCFVCCVLTHGRKDKLYGSDGQLVEISEFTNCFKGIQCISLRGKPKLFFIQACQGKSRQHGVSARENDLETDEGSGHIESIESIPNEADFLISLATLPGYVSYRSKTHGSWYINALYDSLNKYHTTEDLLSILIKVNHEVSTMIAPLDDDEYKQVPLPQATLRKKIYFR